MTQPIPEIRGNGHRFIEELVRAAIANHVAQAMYHTLTEYCRISGEEKTLLGNFGGLLVAQDRRLHVADGQMPGAWRWRLLYSKLRGRGPRAPEKYIGADAFIEVSLTYPVYEGAATAHQKLES